MSVGRCLPRGGSSPCHVNIHFPGVCRYGMPRSHGGRGGLRVPVWQAYVTLSRAPMVRLAFNTWLLQKHWTENSWKGQRPGKERHGGIRKARGFKGSCSSDQSLPPGGSASEHAWVEPLGFLCGPAAPSHRAAHTLVRAGHSSPFWNSSQAHSS